MKERGWESNIKRQTLKKGYEKKLIDKRRKWNNSL